MKSNTNWNLYKTFVTVYETKNMSRAAEILGRTRTAVGQNIKELGHQLGTSLFAAHTKGVEPTAAASNLYKNIKGIIDGIHEAEKNLDAFKATNKETIKIAIANTFAEIFLKKYLKEFWEKYPNIKLDIFKRDGMDLHKQKQLDLVIDVENFIGTSDFKVAELFQTTDSFVATKEYIAKHKIPHTMTIAELLRFPIITRDIAWQVFCEKNNLDPKSYPLAASLPSFDLVHSAINSNPNGIVLYVGDLLHMTQNPDLVVLNVTGVHYPFFKHVYGYTKNLSKSAQTFIDGFIAFAKKNFL